MKSAINNRKSEIAFTLVELLVVITIIAILLALLMPAMDRAVYQAQLASCAARLGAVARTATGYAMDHRGAYPRRRVLDPGSVALWRWPNVVVDERTVASGRADGEPIDDRPMLDPYFGTGLRIMHDPLTGGDQDFAVDDFSVFVDSMLWFSVRFTAAGGGKGMYRLGDCFEWTPAGQTTRCFSVLACDQDWVSPAGAVKAGSSHPDAGSVMGLLSFRASANAFLTRWESRATHERGAIDTNFALVDGSVRRLDAVKHDDTRLERVPLQVHFDGSTVWSQLPEGK